MRRILVMAGVAAVVASVTIVLILISRRVPVGQGVVSVAFLYSTNFSVPVQLGNGTPEFPLFDPVSLGITNAPDSGRVGFFMLTNGTMQRVYCNLEGIEVSVDAEWVGRDSEWPHFGWELRPGQSCIQPVPEPSTDLRWRIRLGVQERGRGLKQAVDRATSKHAQTIILPGDYYQVFSDTVWKEIGEPGSPVNVSQPIRSETNRASSAVGSR